MCLYIYMCVYVYIYINCMSSYFDTSIWCIITIHQPEMLGHLLG